MWFLRIRKFFFFKNTIYDFAWIHKWLITGCCSPILSPTIYLSHYIAFIYYVKNSEQRLFIDFFPYLISVLPNVNFIKDQLIIDPVSLIWSNFFFNVILIKILFILFIRINIIFFFIIIIKTKYVKTRQESVKIREVNLIGIEELHALSEI